jgi:hypothetical protein
MKPTIIPRHNNDPVVIMIIPMAICQDAATLRRRAELASGARRKHPLQAAQ